MNILVTGANGQLGREMQIVSRHSQDHYIFTDVIDGYQKLDITRLDDIRLCVKDNHINCIVNCAAWTNVDAAETAGEIVRQLNAQAPEYLAVAMKEVNGLLVHISTDYVFGSELYNEPCKETQKGTPTGVYGQTKLLGEQLVEATGVEYLIIRTAWLYSEYGKNFLKTMLELMSSRTQLKVVFDQIGTPTYAGDLARAIYEIIENRKFTNHSGIYHYSNEGVCSWYDFAKVIASIANNTTCLIAPCHTNEFPSPVKRPAYSVLDKTKIKNTFGISIPYWMDSLKVCMDRLLNE
ncbi:dTDP-4-dehydrorhamnose reductase [Prevotella sp. A2931]|uniref:dTDP-4-dehydrorhamnose reductase n=1 Tax=Prevotella illustrans TaxID=2800387 RepID=A0ABS3M530_9BACT|nr:MULTISPECIES: dTDP-4-dehydrorhamnose reductase [Prevotella]MBO1363288.1 dTDP-4-dehydrorhamnose reductase [Prevotella illustrans]PTL25839.1 dTDP-4-dehydrorhamnose reductase [Prevotella sp. oral taxon 820]